MDKINSFSIPQTNLPVAAILFILSGGIYLPIWFVKRYRILTQIIKVKLLPKAVFNVLTAILTIALLASGLALAGLRSVNDRFYQQISQGEDILNAFKTDPNLLKAQTDFQSIKYFGDIAIGVVALMLIYQLFAVRGSINEHINGHPAKLRSLGLMPVVISMGIFYLVFAVLSNAEIALLWSGLPLLILIQNKINRLKVNNEG